MYVNFAQFSFCLFRAAENTAIETVSLVHYYSWNSKLCSLLTQIIVAGLHNGIGLQVTITKKNYIGLSPYTGLYTIII